MQLQNIQTSNVDGIELWYALENDVWFNATKMVKKFNEKYGTQKRLDKFWDSIETQEYIEALLEEIQNPQNRGNVESRASESFYKCIAGFGESKGTYVHPELGILLARYLSARFARACDKFIKEKIYNKSQALPDFTNPAEAAEAWAKEYREKQKLALENKAQAKQIEMDKPKVEFATAIETSSNAIMIGAYAKLLSKEHHVSVGPNLLFEFFRDEGILLKSKEKRNLPAARYMNNGYFEVKAETRNGKEILTPLITGKGQIALLDKITKHFGKQNHQPSLFG